MQVIARRNLTKLLALAALGGASRTAPAAAQGRGTLRFVPHADLSILDPLGSTANIVKMHAYMVYDTLFALDADFTPRPQMVQDYSLSEDRKIWRFRLREGLRWHDGTPVTAEDCVASLRRWGARDAAGQLMMRMTENLRAIDDRVFELRLTRPYGIVLESFSKVASNVPFMMPKRVAETDPFTNITDSVGSGPFRFRREEWDPGSKVVYERFDGYVPRAEAPSGFSGGKTAKLDRVEWITIRDQQTALGALQSGQVDLWEAPIMDLLPVLKEMPGVRTRVINKTGTQGQIYFNHTIPPFDNAKARQGMFWLTRQDDYLQAISGNPDFYRSCASFFACGTPMENQAGSEPLLHPDAEKAKALFREAGWDFAQPIVLLDPVDEGIAHPATLVTAQAMRAIGLNVDVQAMAMSRSAICSRSGFTRETSGSPRQTAWLTVTCPFIPRARVRSMIRSMLKQPSWPGSCRWMSTGLPNRSAKPKTRSSCPFGSRSMAQGSRPPTTSAPMRIACSIRSATPGRTITPDCGKATVSISITSA